ncbi:MAG: hypothetical protein O7E54_11725 [Planctomycetota bacterium]|nr:hypothetical protein [Planctomycetota bacterium]
MPRIANDTDAMLADVVRRLERLIAQARKEGREGALEEVRSLVGGAVGARRGRKAAAKPAKRKKKRKSWWDTATAKQKAERVRKMQAGRGLKPKSKRQKKAATGKKAAKTAKKRRNPWKSMTPEQRKERVRKMLAGRGLKPKKS